LAVPISRGKSRNGALKVEAQGAIVDDLDTLGLVVQHLGPGAVVVLIAPLDIVRRDRGAILALQPEAQTECRALRVFGELEALGQRQMVVELLAKVLDQGIVHHIEEIVRRRSTVMPLRVEPTRRDVGVPREHQAAAGGSFPECAFNAAKWGHSGRCPCCNSVRRVSIACAVASSLQPVPRHGLDDLIAVRDRGRRDAGMTGRWRQM
jgi:hypothetical protein